MRLLGKQQDDEDNNENEEQGEDDEVVEVQVQPDESLGAATGHSPSHQGAKFRNNRQKKAISPSIQACSS